MSEATDQPGPAGDPAEDSLSSAPAPRRRRSPIIDAAAVVLGCVVLSWMFGDVRYFFQGSEPRDLGDATTLIQKGLAAEDLAEEYVTLRGTPDVQHAARVRLLEHRPLPGQPVVIDCGSMLARKDEAAAMQPPG